MEQTASALQASPGKMPETVMSAILLSQLLSPLVDSQPQQAWFQYWLVPEVSRQRKRSEFPPLMRCYHPSSDWWSLSYGSTRSSCLRFHQCHDPFIDLDKVFEQIPCGFKPRPIVASILELRAATSIFKSWMFASKGCFAFINHCVALLKRSKAFSSLLISVVSYMRPPTHSCDRQCLLCDLVRDRSV